ncbi:hypothetical protein J2741_002584 [Methanolinea mesophila]|uniref:hypothetical protein n=1 Tax=Methanolinea mesophila TaxID=547055 RepID=UPI001AEB4700|nr:hypothetical protein [Methanolinea mesophila]MBP1929988.1 hypothetical protein [Methanolinea mesophila]
MKFSPLIVSIFILAIVITPVLAVSASDLIAKHQTGSSFAITIPTRFFTVSPTEVPTPLVTGTLTAVPSPRITLTPYPTRNVSSLFDLFQGRSIFTIPTIGPRPTPSPGIPHDRTLTCPPDKPVGELHHCLCTCVCFVGEDCSWCVDPETGYTYPFGVDDAGREFIIKPGCNAKWADE